LNGRLGCNTGSDMKVDATAKNKVWPSGAADAAARAAFAPPAPS
jgi:hypothetical protein